MNSLDQAQKGFKTFIITLIVSLVSFSFLYYLISGFSARDVDINDSAEAASPKVISANVDKNPFEKLSREKVDVPAKVVLAGADVADTDTPESTQATVPDTGATEITYALFISLVILSVGGYLIALGPRNLALSGFERKVRKDL